MEAMDKAEKGPVLPVDVDHDFVICEIQNKPACQWPFSRVICFFSLGIRSTIFLCFEYILQLILIISSPIPNVRNVASLQESECRRISFLRLKYGYSNSPPISEAKILGGWGGG